MLTSALRQDDVPVESSSARPPLRVLQLTLYGRLAASSRVRFFQYETALRANNIEVVAAPLLDDRYVADRHAGRRPPLTGVVVRYVERLRQLLRIRQFDVVWIQSELFPWLPGWAEWFVVQLGVPYVVEYDDAVFHRYDANESRIVRRVLGRKLDAVMRRAALVIAGNEYLAERARRAGAADVACLPSVVDLEHYAEPAALRWAPAGENAAVTIGWIGSRWTARYLNAIAPALREVCARRATRIVVVGAESSLEGLSVEARPWSERSEAAEVAAFDIGVMPLDDGPWEQGKCGYKLVQYMACSKPVVASPVGMNREIVTHGVNGFLAGSETAWTAALLDLHDDARLRRRMGAEGRRRIEQLFSLQAAAPRLCGLLRRAAAAPQQALGR